MAGSRTPCITCITLQATMSGKSCLYPDTLAHLCGLQALGTSQGKLYHYVSPRQLLPTSLHSQAAAGSRFPALEVPLKHCRCIAVQANEACPLPCASGSPDGCTQRFQCHKGCPLCIPPPQDRLCNGFKQVGPPPRMRQSRFSERLLQETLHSSAPAHLTAKLLARDPSTSIVLMR